MRKKFKDIEQVLQLRIPEETNISIVTTLGVLDFFLQ